MSHRHRTWRSVLADGIVPPALRTLREERWWAKSLMPFPGFQSRDGGNISPRIQAGEEVWVEGRRGWIGQSNEGGPATVARKPAHQERISGLALGHRKTLRRRPTEGPQAAGLL